MALEHRRAGTVEVAGLETQRPRAGVHGLNQWMPSRLGRRPGRASFVAGPTSFALSESGYSTAFAIIMWQPFSPSTVCVTLRSPCSEHSM